MVADILITINTLLLLYLIYRVNCRVDNVIKATHVKVKLFDHNENLEREFYAMEDDLDTEWYDDATGAEYVRDRARESRGERAYVRHLPPDDLDLFL